MFLYIYLRHSSVEVKKTPEEMREKEEQPDTLDLTAGGLVVTFMHVYYEGSAEDFPPPGMFRIDLGCSRVRLFFILLSDGISSRSPMVFGGLWCLGKHID